MLNAPRIHAFMAALGCLLPGVCCCGESSASVTTLSQFAVASNPTNSVAQTFSLTGDLLWISPASKRAILRDASSTKLMQFEPMPSFLRAGQRVSINGVGVISTRGNWLQLGTVGPVVDNDGVHSMQEKAGVVYLKHGRQPIRVEWFNATESSGLKVEFSGPEIGQGSIPDKDLFLPGTNDNGVRWEKFHCIGEALPNLTELSPQASGITSNFTSQLFGGEHVAVRFEGEMQIPREGIYTFHLSSDDGSRLYAGAPSVEVSVIGEAAWPKPVRISIGQPIEDGADVTWAEVQGRVVFARRYGDGIRLDIASGSGRMKVEIPETAKLDPALMIRQTVRLRGFCESVLAVDGQRQAGLIYTPGEEHIEILPPPTEQNVTHDGSSLPLLRTAAEVHRLRREDAQQAYPVKIRGVVTCELPEHQAATVQDSTRGIYFVDYSTYRSAGPRQGDHIEVEGTTDPGLFAPVVNASSLINLGSGVLPEPIRPAWDQLQNGSLDAQYVELAGIITEAHTNYLTMLTAGGVISVELRLNRERAQDLSGIKNALVRIRGCLFASWDYVTHRVRVGEVRIYGADLSIDEPPPADLFVVPRKRASELLLFDPEAGAFQRVRVAGQIVHVQDSECFLMDGQTGLRLRGRSTSGLAPGDMVECVGFPQIGNSAAPVLLEAIFRKSGHDKLPEPRPLSADKLVNPEWDATRVRIEGTLVSHRRSGASLVLEVQNGIRTFAAVMPHQQGKGIESTRVGSRLGLTGVYSIIGAVKPAEMEIGAFELLLSSADDVQVLARPSWWTLEKLMVALGGLGGVLLLSLLWITQLRRQVEERSAELETQIQVRQRAESQRAMEQERSRIAADLHDDLGSSITEVSMLASRAAAPAIPEVNRSEYLATVREKTHDMVTALDEIVWAMNPRHDSLGSLASYLCLHADRLLRLANIGWKFEGPDPLPELHLPSQHRHELFLAFKEALTNIVRHSGASEVRLRMNVSGSEVELIIADNGRGTARTATESAGMDGIANMHARLGKIGGRCEIRSTPGQGTTVSFQLPLSTKI